MNLSGLPDFSILSISLLFSNMRVVELVEQLGRGADVFLDWPPDRPKNIRTSYSFVVAWYVEYLAADADQWAARVHFFNTVGLVQPMIVVGLLLAVGSLKLHRE